MQLGKTNAEINNKEQSSSSEDDEDAELLTEELEKGFFKVLSRLKKKDEQLYDENVKYYPVESAAEGGLQNRQKKGKKVSEKDYKIWLKGQKESVENDVREDLEGLHDFWASPNINKDDQFLRDYILNKKFLDPDENFSVEKELEKLSDEEKELQEEIAFEHKYNYRFENPDPAFLKKYPHTVGKAFCKRSNIHPPTETLTRDKKPKLMKVTKSQKVKMKNKISGAEINLHRKSEEKVFGKKRKSNCFVETTQLNTEQVLNLKNKSIKDKIKLKNNKFYKTQPSIEVEEIEECIEKKRKIHNGVEVKANLIKNEQSKISRDLEMISKSHKRKPKHTRKSDFGATVETTKIEIPVKSDKPCTTPKKSPKKELPTGCLEKGHIEVLNRLKKNVKNQYQQKKIKGKKNQQLQRTVKAKKTKLTKAKKFRHRLKNKQKLLQSYPIKDAIIKKRKERHRSLH